MQARERALVHSYFYQERDKNNWSVGKKQVKRCVSYGWNSREYKVSTRYDGPAFYLFDRCLAMLVPDPKNKAHEVLFVTDCRFSKGTHLEDEYASKTTREITWDIVSSAPNIGVTIIRIPGEVVGDNLEHRTPGTVAKENFQTVYNLLKKYDEHQYWKQGEARMYWERIVESSLTFLNKFPNAATKKQKNDLVKFRKNFEDYYSSVKVDGYKCSGYEDWKERLAIHSTYLREMKRIKDERNSQISLYQLDRHRDQHPELKPLLDIFDAYKEKLLGFISNDSILATMLLDVCNTHCGSSFCPTDVKGGSEDGYNVIHYMLDQEGYHASNVYSWGFSKYTRALRALNIGVGDAVFPVYKDGKIASFITNRNADLAGNMVETLKKMTVIALHDLNALAGRHIGPYTCYGATSDGCLGVGCHKFSLTAIEFLRNILDMSYDDGEALMHQLCKDKSNDPELRAAATAKFESAECKGIIEAASIAADDIFHTYLSSKEEYLATAEINAKKNHDEALAQYNLLHNVEQL